MGLKSYIQQKVRSFFLTEKSASESSPISLLNSGGYRYFFRGLDGHSYNTRDVAEFMFEGYGRNPYVYSVVDRIADVCAGLPRYLCDEEGGEIRASMDSLSFESLMKYPNHLDYQSDLYHKIITSLLVSGNAFIVSVEGEMFTAGRPGSLFVALPQNVTIQTDNGREWGMPRSYTITQRGTFPAEQVMHMRFPNLVEDTNWGLSPLYSGQAVYTGSNSTFSAKASIFENRGVSGILSAKQADMPMMPEEQQRLQRDWNSRTAGSDKFGGIHMTTASLEFLDVGMSPKDLKLLENNLENLRDVCRIYGVDSSLFGDPQNRTYSNQEQAIEAFYTDVVLPLSDKIDRQISAWLLEKKFSIQNAKWCVDLEGVKILNKPEADLSGKVITEVNAGIITANEARAILYPELPELSQPELREDENDTD